MRPEQQNLIGKTITINGITGTVQDETKHTIIMQGKTYIKETTTIMIDGKRLDNQTITKTPAERIKVHKK